jgi:hypothetical protein
MKEASKVELTSGYAREPECARWLGIPATEPEDEDQTMAA